DKNNSETFVKVLFYIDINMAQNNDLFETPLLVDPNDDGDNQPHPQQPIPIQHVDLQVHKNNPQNDPMTLLAQQFSNLILHMQNALLHKFT
ncbi:11891_t:CDS:1, partial [Dentiscutata heterogama]